MKFENGIFGFVNQDEWLSVGTNVTRPNDPIDGLFGDIRTQSIVAKWQTIADEYQTPVMAQFHGFDTEAKTTFRVPIDTHNVEKGLIKVKINQSERLRELMKTGVVGDQELYDYVLNDGIRLADQVVTRTKVAKNELLASGVVTIKENNLDLTVDYGVPAANKAFTLDLSEGADVASQLQTIVDAAHDLGLTIDGMVTQSKNLSKMRRNPQLQVDINGTLGAGALIPNAALRDYLSAEFGITRIVVNDQSYGADAVIGANGRPTITMEKYFPADKITFFASRGGKIGDGLWGDPPEVSASRYFDGGVTASNYVYVSQWGENDPAVTWTKASGLFIPMIYNPNSLFIATVTEPEGETGETGATGQT